MHARLLVSRHSHSGPVMKMVRQVIVFDAAELHAESAFWAGFFGGHVFEDPSREALAAFVADHLRQGNPSDDA
jgi:hypothetical protein